MKRFPALVFLIVLLVVPFNAAAVTAASHYEYTATMRLNDLVLVSTQDSQLKLTIDADKNSGELALLVFNASTDKLLTIVFDQDEVSLNSIDIKAVQFNDYLLVTISSAEPIEISLNPNNINYEEELQRLKDENEQLQTENEQLKAKLAELEKQVAELQAKLSNQEDVTALHQQILNLTKENRALKEELANQTQQLNYYKSKAEYLEKQNQEWRTLFGTIIEEQAEQSEHDYIAQAEKQRSAASLLWKVLILTVVAGVGVLWFLDRKRRKYYTV